MKTPPHLAHLFATGGPNRAPIFSDEVDRFPQSPMRPIPRRPRPPSIIRTGPGVLYTVPLSKPTGIITR